MLRILPGGIVADRLETEGAGEEVSVVIDLPDGWRPPPECASKLLEIALAVRDRRAARERAA
jgi:hypothetical protein